MPLLAIALITSVIYKAIAEGLHWGGEVSRTAWDASMAHSRSLGERLRRAAQARLDDWMNDPGLRGYAAFGLKMGLGVTKGLGKLGLWTALGAAKAAGATVRGLGSGALLGAGLLGALSRGAHQGAALGAQWWDERARRRSERAERLRERAERWGDTVSGDVIGDPVDLGPDPFVADDPPEAPPSDPGPAPEPPPMPPPAPRAPYQAGAATVGESARARTGTGTALLDRPTSPVLEGEIMTTTKDALAVAAPTTAVAVAPGGTMSAADGMQYEASQTFLAQQAQRAGELAGLAEQIQLLQAQLAQGATVMRNDHEQAQAGLARFGVVAPNVAHTVELLMAVANGPGPAHMLATFDELNQIAAGCSEDAQVLATRHGTAWELTKAANIDGQFYNG